MAEIQPPPTQQAPIEDTKKNSGGGCFSCIKGKDQNIQDPYVKKEDQENIIGQNASNPNDPVQQPDPVADNKGEVDASQPHKKGGHKHKGHKGHPGHPGHPHTNAPTEAHHRKLSQERKNSKDPPEAPAASPSVHETHKGPHHQKNSKDNPVIQITGPDGTTKEPHARKNSRSANP